MDDFSTYKALFDTNIEYPDAIIATDIPVLTNLCSLWSITLLGPNDPEDHNKVAELSRSASRKGIILFDWRDTIPLDISAEQIERHILEYLQTGTFEDAVNLERISPPLGATKTRLCIFSDDRQGSLARVLGYISDFGINVHALTNQGNGDV